jgi:hypothetical protein
MLIYHLVTWEVALAALLDSGRDLVLVLLRKHINQFNKRKNEAAVSQLVLGITCNLVAWRQHRLFHCHLALLARASVVLQVSDGRGVQTLQRKQTKPSS